MDPNTRFPTECLEDIFRHFSDKYLLKCTLVCPAWNEFIETTRSCMKKIKLKYSNVERISVEMKTVLKNSQRKYETLMLEGKYSKEMQEILSAEWRKWTRVYSFKHDLVFETVNSFWNFLRIFRSSVQDLFWLMTSVTEGFEPDSVFAELQFP